MLPTVIYQDLGRIAYHTAWDYQFATIKQVIDKKLTIKNLEPTPSVNFTEKLIAEQKSYLLFCEHNLPRKTNIHKGIGCNFVSYRSAPKQIH